MTPSLGGHVRITHAASPSPMRLELNLLEPVPPGVTPTVRVTPATPLSQFARAGD